jgi:hypothetical protein
VLITWNLRYLGYKSGILRDFEKFLKNPVTFWADLRLKIIGTTVIGRSYGAALVLALVRAELAGARRP